MIVQERGAKMRNQNGSADEKEGLVEDLDSDGDFELQEEGLEQNVSYKSMSRRRPWTKCCNSFMDNLPKIIILIFAFLSVVILVFLRNRGETAALICIEEVSKELEVIPYPVVDFSKVKKGKDYTRYAAVKAEKWIVVAVTGPPTPQVESLANLKDWQLLAVATTSDVPEDWRLPNVIFLSLAQQAELGYRILKYVPYHSYIRKNVGYLFAVHHGARKIYDADEKASLLHDDLANVFDVELSGPGSKREPVLQYRYFETRKVVNPFVHFGQRSVWPRGLPLESVNEISPEIFYAEVTNGRQFIQQSLADGLPDVDSIFYYTRKIQGVSFDLKFDSFAPPITLPQGHMAPVNALNTLYHSPAFWSLLLPVSVGTKTADVVRGYWGQRILWEVGGVLGVYPPMIHRQDTLQPPAFEDEKDLYAKVGNLITYLVNWRSDKSSVFEKILHLSYSMAEQGFWTVQDIQLTAAWLQDLVSLGYRQPRLLAGELDRNRTSWSSLGHRQYLPHTFSAPYLGVEDTSGMASQMADLIRWRHFFGNIVLILECDGPSNHTVLGWRMFYGRLFKHVVIFSQEHPDLGVEESTGQVYNALGGIFDRHPNADGFLIIKDDVVLNYWNLVSANKTKLWNLQKVPASWVLVGMNDNGTEWYNTPAMAKRVQKAVKNMPPKFRKAYRSAMDDDHYVMSTSDVYYVPQRHVTDFITLVTPCNKAQLRSEIAIPLIFLAMDTPDNYDSTAFSNTLYIEESQRSLDPATFYRTDLDAIHPWRATTDLELTRIFKTVGQGDPHLLDAFD